MERGHWAEQEARKEEAATRRVLAGLARLARQPSLECEDLGIVRIRARPMARDARDELDRLYKALAEEEQAGAEQETDRLIELASRGVSGRRWKMGWMKMWQEHEAATQPPEQPPTPRPSPIETAVFGSPGPALEAPTASESGAPIELGFAEFAEAVRQFYESKQQPALADKAAETAKKYVHDQPRLWGKLYRKYGPPGAECTPSEELPPVVPVQSSPPHAILDEGHHQLLLKLCTRCEEAPEEPQTGLGSFEAAVAFFKDDSTGKAWAKAAGDEEKLEIYGLFKQQKDGDCNTDRPGMFSPSERYKWDAWNSHKGMSADQARAAYVKVANEQKDKYGI